MRALYVIIFLQFMFSFIMAREYIIATNQSEAALIVAQEARAQALEAKRMIQQVNAENKSLREACNNTNNTCHQSFRQNWNRFYGAE